MFRANPPSTRRVQIFRWVFRAILVIAGAGLLLIQLRPELSHQQRNVLSGAVVLGSGLLGLAWFVLAGPFRWKTRLGFCAGILALAGGAAGLFRIRGVSGDLLPILEWRYGGSQTAPGWRTNATRPTVPQTVDVARPTGDSPYNQFLGPYRNGTVPPVPLATDWAERPPRLLWRHPIGAGWSGFVTSGNLAVTQEQRGQQEAVVAYHVHSGEELWAHIDNGRYFTVIAGEGPRATPTIAGPLVYTMGALGTLNCLELASGRVRWKKNVPEENQGRVGEWGVSCSPLVWGDLVVVTTGAGENRSLAAYRRETGELAWRSGGHHASYSSPIQVSIGGVDQVVIVNASTVVSHNARTGTVLWEHPWPSANPHVTAPLLLPDDQVLLSSGYGVGCELIQVGFTPPDRWRAERRWKTIALKSKFGNLVFSGGFVYGLDDGILVCLDPTTGQRRWKDGRYGHGQLIECGKLLLVMAENGEVVLVEATPERHNELTRFRVLRGKTWNPPCLSDNFLIVRNDQEAASYQLPLQKQP